MGFREAFYQQYFSAADKNAYVREYAAIRQRDDESVSDYLARFLRLAGFAGPLAGTSVEQAEKFKWTIHFKYCSKLINEKFTDVAEAAYAAKNIEMERQDVLASKSDNNKKRSRDGQQIQQVGQQPQRQGGNRGNQWGQNGNKRQGQGHGQNQNQNQGQNQSYRQQGQGQNQMGYQKSVDRGNSNVAALCKSCGRRHPGNICYRATGACFHCGQMGHLAKDCKNPRRTDGGIKSGHYQK